MRIVTSIALFYFQQSIKSSDYSSPSYYNATIYSNISLRRSTSNRPSFDLNIYDVDHKRQFLVDAWDTLRGNQYPSCSCMSVNSFSSASSALISTKFPSPPRVSSFFSLTTRKTCPLVRPYPSAHRSRSAKCPSRELIPSKIDLSDGGHRTASTAVRSFAVWSIHIACLRF